MIGLTLNLARRVIGFMQKSSAIDISRLNDVARILRVKPDSLVNSSYRFVENAKRKGLPHEPIFEPRKWVRRDKSNSIPLKGKDGKWKTYFPTEPTGNLYNRYPTKRSITGKGERTLGEYLTEQWQGWRDIPGRSGPY